MTLPASILVPVLVDRGRAQKASLAALSVAAARAAELGGAVDAVVVGERLPAELLSGLGSYGASQVFWQPAEPRLPQPWVELLSDRLDGGGYGYVIVAEGPLGLAVAGGVAGRTRGGLATDVSALRVENGQLVAEKPVFRGSQVADVHFRRGPAVIVARPGAFRVGEPHASEAIVQELKPPASQFSVELLASSGVEDPGGDLALADVIVTGGRGLGDASGFAAIEALADALERRVGEAAVGATRAVVDAGWRQQAAQIGLTGRSVSPTLYVAVGVSGAPQHRTGMETSEHILAINHDPRAPIFKFADLGVVADLHELLPALTQRLSDTPAEGDL